MLRLHQLRLSLDDAVNADEDTLRALAARRLRVPLNGVVSARLVKRSVDARDKGDVYFAVTLDVTLADNAREGALAKRFRPNEVAIVSAREEAADAFSLNLPPWDKSRERPVVVGMGPAGLFCAIALAARGARPIVLERGRPVEERARDVEAFEAGGALNEESNALFGEGGAGAFSDGKLTCGINSPHIRTVLQTLYACGAPEEILWSQRPHIGTDALRPVLASARERLIALGADIRFGHKLVGLVMRGGRVVAARYEADGAEGELATDAVCLAIGHSARDTYEWLYRLGVPMRIKPFAIGARIEHRQADINAAQYGRAAGHPALPPAEYKLNVPTPDGRGVYTFCMCPGGRVIAACSEAGGINVNGMSLHARDGENANAALLVGVRPTDFPDGDPLSAVRLQREIERAAFDASGGWRAPCQRVEDFLARRPSTGAGRVSPSIRPGAFMGEIDACLPDFVTDNLRYALPLLGRRLRGFDAPDAILTAPETRSSAPVQMLRDERAESSMGGLYPLGEGAGHAGGIVSAAVDGLKAGMGL